MLKQVSFLNDTLKLMPLFHVQRHIKVTETPRSEALRIISTQHFANWLTTDRSQLCVSSRSTLI